MKRLIYTFMIALTFSCQSEKEKAELSGSWYSCANNGDYVEMHIKGNQYRYSSDFMSPTHWNQFAVQSDTLIQYDKFLLEDSVVIKQAKITFTERGELNVAYFTSDEHWTFKRIKGAVIDSDDYYLLHKGTIERSKKINCIDYRTDEERKIDSLNRQTDFKF